MSKETEHELPDFQKGAKRAEGTEPQWTQCGHCKRWWDDSLCTSLTPVPAGRCPFEYEHEYPEDHKIKVVYTDGDEEEYDSLEKAEEGIAETMTGCDFAISVEYIEDLETGEELTDHWTCRIRKMPV